MTNCDSIDALLDSGFVARRLKGSWTVVRESKNVCHFALVKLLSGRPMVALSIRLETSRKPDTITGRSGWSLTSSLAGYTPEREKPFKFQEGAPLDEDIVTAFVEACSNEVEVTSAEKIAKRVNPDATPSSAKKAGPLTNAEILRYGRQLILPELGVTGQTKLKKSSALIVGAGGLGCPSAIYLAASGVGRLGIVDYDDIEVSNLHRQILHQERRVGVAKAVSLSDACRALNSKCTIEPLVMQLDSGNAMDLIKNYDIVVDCTDNVATRYLLNDACVLSGKPLVSGSALRWQGQLTVYNWKHGPCYRCLFPLPPPPETVTNCSDGGVIGAVPGVIGTLQALEVLKILTGRDPSFSQKLLLFDGFSGVFRSIKLRARKDDCCVCGKTPTIDRLIDYEQFCGAPANDKDFALHLLSHEERASVEEYANALTGTDLSVLIDVRTPVEIEICRLPATEGAFIHLPLDVIKGGDEERVTNVLEAALNKGREGSCKTTAFVVCKRGNDSQIAVPLLKTMCGGRFRHVTFKDISGGLYAWNRRVDPDFPIY